jgi:site-specific DNA-methyltransferase (adenine-specific)
MNLTDRIRITNEDNMAMMARYPDKHFDLAIVDPPYGIVTNGNAQDRFRMGKDLTNVNDNKPTQDYFVELFRVSENQIIWGYNWLSDMLPICREYVFWYKKQPVVTFADGELAWTSFQKTAKCFEYPFYLANAENKSTWHKIHPTQKPVALYKWLLKNYATPDMKILDTHLGSGSIAIACHEFGCDLTACELDADYYRDAIKRIQSHISQTNLFL